MTGERPVGKLVVVLHCLYVCKVHAQYAKSETLAGADRAVYRSDDVPLAAGTLSGADLVGRMGGSVAAHGLRSRDARGRSPSAGAVHWLLRFGLEWGDVGAHDAVYWVPAG